LLGLRRGLLIAAVSSGGLLGGALMALAADHFAGRLIRLQNVQRDPLVKYGSIAAVLLILVVIVWALHRAYRRALGQARARRQSSPQPVA
jgi:ABC-type nickel/cobalt efflux system permease component RcnA